MSGQIDKTQTQSRIQPVSNMTKTRSMSAFHGEGVERKPYKPLLRFKGSSYNCRNMAEYNKIADEGEIAFIRKNSRVIIVGKCDESDFWGKTKSMDGKIGKVKQGETGDCWLIAAINSLSYNPKGRQIIKESIKYTKDGAIVNFRGLDCMVYVPYSEVYKAKLSTTFAIAYSSGDDDVKIIELATEKVIEEHCKGNIDIDESINFFKPISEDLDGNFPDTAWKLLVGDKARIECYDDINNLAANKPDVATYSFGRWDYTCDFSFLSLSECRKVTDLKTGEKVKLYPYHAYSIKKIYKDTVLLVNPLNNDSKETILVSKKEIEKGRFDAAKID